MRKVLKDLRRAELIAAKDHDKVRAAARGEGHGSQAAESITAPRRGTQGRRQSGTDRPTQGRESHAFTDAQPRDSDDEDSTGQGAEIEDAAASANDELASGLWRRR
jgi:hypothetical protein